MENKKLQETAMILSPGGDTGGTDRPTTGGGDGGSTNGDDPK